MKIEGIEKIGDDLIRIYGLSKILQEAGFHTPHITFTINISDLRKVIDEPVEKSK